MVCHVYISFAILLDAEQWLLLGLLGEVERGPGVGVGGEEAR